MLKEGGEVVLEKAHNPQKMGGIKVLCREENRYYIYVNGEDTGLLCPTERIHLGQGNHVVEVFDLKTGQTKRFETVVKQTRISKRVRVDYEYNPKKNRK